jgi:hypothetical protein
VVLVIQHVSCSRMRSEGSWSSEKGTGGSSRGDQERG